MSLPCIGFSGTYAATGTSRTWEVRRWEGRFLHDDAADLAKTLEADVERSRIWEDDAGTIVGVAHPDATGEAHFRVGGHDVYLEEDMLTWAESALTLEGADGTRRLTTFSLAVDDARTRLLDGGIEIPQRDVSRFLTIDGAAQYLVTRS